MRTSFLLSMAFFTVINSPLFSLNEYRSLQMKQENIKRLFEPNGELGNPCVVNGCSLKEADGMVMVEVSWRVEEGGIWINKSIFFIISEVYYGFNSRQKMVIYRPFLLHEHMVNPSITRDYDGIMVRKAVDSRTFKRVYLEVPGGGGSGHNVSIDDPPSPGGVAMLKLGITVAVVDYRPLLEYNEDFETPLEDRKRIAFVWDQYKDLTLALRKVKEMGFEVVGTFGHSYGAYLCSLVEAKSPGLQGRLFLGAGIYDVFNDSEYWFHWFGGYLPGEDLLNQWSPANTYFEGDNVFIACPAFDMVVSPAHSFWLKGKWPKAILKEYPSGHNFIEVDQELWEDLIKWIFS